MRAVSLDLSGWQFVEPIRSAEGCSGLAPCSCPQRLLKRPYCGEVMVSACEEGRPCATCNRRRKEGARA